MTGAKLASEKLGRCSFDYRQFSSPTYGTKSRFIPVVAPDFAHIVQTPKRAVNQEPALLLPSVSLESVSKEGESLGQGMRQPIQLEDGRQSVSHEFSKKDWSHFLWLRGE